MWLNCNFTVMIGAYKYKVNVNFADLDHTADVQ